MTDYITPDGTRAIFCQTLFVRVRQHLTLEGLCPTATACGHPVGDWSTGELRTLVGLTCRTCVRNVTKHGKTRPTPVAKLDGGEQYTRTFYGWDKTPEEWKR